MSFRRRHRALYYRQWKIEPVFEGLRIDHLFELEDGPSFAPSHTICLPAGLDYPSIDSEVLQSLVFHLGLVELISYWKAACPPEIHIHGASLSPFGEVFFRKLWYLGLGEFFYRNQINTNMNTFVRLHMQGDAYDEPKPCATLERCLVPVGGGKDSLVTLSEMKQGMEEVLALMVNPSEACERSCDVMGIAEDRRIRVRRTIDPALLELNEQNYLNGHTPFSAMLGFLSVTVGAVTGSHYVALSNESSANESTVPGTNINHQWSKSLEFEQDFQEYIEDYVTPDIHYFSWQRPRNELQIAKRLVEMDREFPENEGPLSVFRSCNVGSKGDRWCGRCAKCVFVAVMFLPFVEPGKIVEMMGTDPLQDAELEHLLEELAGASKVKPFECVGTVDEVRAALRLAFDRGGSMDYQSELPLLVRKFIEKHSDLLPDSKVAEAVLREKAEASIPRELRDMWIPLGAEDDAS